MTLPRIFAGERVFVLGGGPSLCDQLRFSRRRDNSQEIVARLPAERCIVINSTARLMPAAAVLVFSDWGWFSSHRPIVDSWPGIVVTTCARAARVLPAKLHLVAPPIVMAETMTSGHHALDVVAAMGAAEIVLLGFDCRTVDGRSHHHDDYPVQLPEAVYRDKIAPLWAGWRSRMERKGVRCVNSTPGSAIDEFTRMALDEVL